MKKLSILVVVAIISAGCKGKDEQASPSEPAAVAPDMGAITQPLSAGSADDVLVQIGDTKLTRGDAEMETTVRMSGMQNRMPAQQLQSMRQRMLRNVTDQFVMRTVLLQEADKLKIEVSKPEEKEAFDKIRERLPPGKTLEEVMKTSPMGEDRMRQEVLVGIRINKLLSETLTTNPVPVSAEEITTFIEENQARLKRPEKARARHILITVSTNDTALVKGEKKAKAEGLRKQIVDGGDFAALAGANSDCPSKSRGGDLGMFGRGQMVPPFEKAAFGWETNAVGPVVETRFGYHVIEVMERQEAGTVPREEVESMLSNRKQQERVREYIEGLRAKADIKYSDPTLAPPPPPPAAAAPAPAPAPAPAK